MDCFAYAHNDDSLDSKTILDFLPFLVGAGLGVHFIESKKFIKINKVSFIECLWCRYFYNIKRYNFKKTFS